jgi:hypothetical protein
MYNSISMAFDEPLLRTSWQTIASSVVVTEQSGEEKFWLGEDVGGLMAGVDMTDNQSYKTAPTVISGVGLLATFLAILVALLDVKLAQNRVQGLDLLVQGLSGKFLSSVVAVACATILVYAEKGLTRPVLAGVASLTATLRSLIPRLMPAQILVNLHNEVAAQSEIFKTSVIELGRDVKDGLSESILPTLQRLGSAVDNFGLVVQEDRARREESMKEQFKLLFKDLGQSLETSLDRTASRLIDSLAANTQAQLTQVSKSSSKTVDLLCQMNEHLARNQDVFNSLLDLTKDSSVEEITLGQARIEQLTGAINELIVKLQEKSGEPMGQTEKILAAIAGDISDKVMDLSTRMAAIVEETSEKSANKAKEVIDQAGTISSRSALHLAQLLERHSSELTRVEDLRALLDSTIKGFIFSIDKYSHVTEGLHKVASQVNAGVVSLGQIAGSIKESQEAATRVSMSVSSHIQSMNDFTHGQREVWERIRGSMAQYEEVFGRVEEHAGDLLAQIARHLKGYSDSTEKHFSGLALAADNLIAQATGRLSVSIDELAEQLDELQIAASAMAQVSQKVA